MVITLNPTSKARRFSLLDRACAFGIVLQEEFGAPFKLYNGTTGEEVVPTPAGSSSPGRLTPAEVLRAADAESYVSPCVLGRYQLVLPLADGDPTLVAVGLLTSLAGTPADVEQERCRLQRWLQSVKQRLCGP